MARPTPDRLVLDLQARRRDHRRAERGRRDRGARIVAFPVRTGGGVGAAQHSVVRAAS